MAIQFVVEDGSGKVDATSYVDTTTADQYHENRGNATWAALSTDDKQTALNRATAYIDSYFDWATGKKNDQDQALDWPRIGAYDGEGYLIDNDTIPQQVQDASCELGLRASSEDIFPDSERPMKSFRAGPVEIEFEEGTSTYNIYNQALNILRDLVYGLGQSVRLDLV